jgi:hypothetical protein
LLKKKYLNYFQFTLTSNISYILQEQQRLAPLLDRLRRYEADLKALYKRRWILQKKFDKVKHTRRQKFENMYDFVNDNIDATYKVRNLFFYYYFLTHAYPTTEKSGY